jgi:hypothetical protein
MSHLSRKSTCKCLQTLEEGGYNERLIAMPRSARSAALLVKQMTASLRKRGEGNPALACNPWLWRHRHGGTAGPARCDPAFELDDERRIGGCAHCQTLLRRQSVDLTLDLEDRVDPAHCRDGEWRPLRRNRLAQNSRGVWRRPRSCYRAVQLRSCFAARTAAGRSHLAASAFM